ncbi:TIGR00269 family protein [Candidatus Woesearchaeota archaeon CG_4_10_14_0_2_um_filter_33_13]|nr:MAG: TIGR00269 family protein [Candidatus Woesearchaeota archaeon CG_4_10_14_0_2_um_filter_33_13]
MQCSKCSGKAVIQLQHGSLCKIHFLNYFEEKVFKTIKKYKLIDRNDRICVAASGGKDSLTVLYLTKKYLEQYDLKTNLFALLIDEGIANYRKTTIKDLKTFCKEHKIKLVIASAKEEFGYTLDRAYPIINKETKKKPCNICGVWRRYLINKYARKNKATKLVTGHNLDDEAQAIIMNTFKANTSLSAHLGPVSGIEDHDLFVQRVKPLYFCAEKETRLYCLLKGFQVDFTECPYAQEGLRAKVRDMLNDFENQYKGTKQSIINSFLEVLPLIKEHQIKINSSPLNICKICQEPANQEICNTCKLKEVLKNGKKKRV